MTLTKNTSRGEYLPPHGVNTVHQHGYVVSRPLTHRVRLAFASGAAFKGGHIRPSHRCTNCTPILFPTPVLPERQPQPDYPTHSSSLWLIPLSLMYAYYRASNQWLP
jgi:hypothetical protein